jgi:hypothetical protein
MDTTKGLQLYSNFTDNKIGQAISASAPKVLEKETYYEYSQLVQFRLDAVINSFRTKYVRWRLPKTGYHFWQFRDIQNNNTGLVTVNFAHIMNGLYSHINSIHRAKIGGSIVGGQLQPAGGLLNITVQRQVSNGIGIYVIQVNGTSGQSFTFNANPDALSPENANEIDFATGI